MANKPKFAVLGAGNGGRAIAAYLAVTECDVSLYNRTPENIRNIQQLGGIYLRYTPYLEEDIFTEDIARKHDLYFEGIERLEAELRHEYSLTPKTERLVEEDVRNVFGELNTISSDIEEVMGDRDVIMVAVPASGHRYMAEKCAPHLKEGQTILLHPGRCLGAIEFYNVIHDHYKEKESNPPDVTIAEAQTFIYVSRRTKPRSVRIFGVKDSVDIAAIPSNKTRDVVNLIEEYYPQFTPTENVLTTSLGNLGGVFHVPITILNAARIDRRHEFDYYIDGVTEHTASIIEDVDKERLAIAEAMGVKAVSARRWLHQTYGSEGTDLYEAIQNTHAYKGIESPGSINHRYIWEDVPTSLVPLSSLGKKLGIPTPLIDSFIYQATSALRKDLKIDFFETGRTMEKLGLDDMSIDEIKEFVETGYN